MKDKTINVYEFEGKKKVQFINKPNNTTMTYDAQDVLDVLNEFMKGVK